MTAMTAETKAKIIVVLNSITLVGGIITILLVLRLIGNAATSTSQTSQEIKNSQQVTEKELRCLAAFFSHTDRQNLRISDLSKCKILHTDTGQTEILPLAPTAFNPSSTPAVPENDTKQNSTPKNEATQPKPSQTATNPNSSTSQALSQPAPQVQVPSNKTKPAKRLMGIPLCVPFSHLCIR